MDIIKMIGSGNYQTAGNPRIGTLKTTKTFSDITSPGYINSIMQEPISPGDLIVANYGLGQTSLFTVSFDSSGIISLSPNNGYSSYINGFTVYRRSFTSVGVFPGACRDYTNSDDIVLENLSLTAPDGFSIDITKNGFNGLDSGSLQSSTWYGVYVISDSTGNNPTGGVISLNGISPPVEDAFVPPTLPPGYDLYRRVGWTYINASSQVSELYSIGNGLTRTYIKSFPLANVLTNGHATSFTLVDLSAAIPNFYQSQIGLASRLIEACFEITYASSLNGSQLDFAISNDSIGTYALGTAVTSKTSMWLPVGVADISGNLIPYIKYKTTNAGDAVSFGISKFRDYL